MLKLNSKFPRKILDKVIHKENGKNLKSKDNIILVQEDELTVYKFDVEDSERVKSQKFRVSTNYGEIVDFDFFEKKNWLIILTKLGSLQILDGINKCSNTHKPQKISSKILI